jgi:dipeptidyl aminopeptidase/acylaminoacyl peptidase
LTSDLTLNVDSFNWSPDSTRLAFSASHNPLLAFSGEQDLYLLDLTHGNVVSKIVALPGPDVNPMFSPDGKQLAFSTALGDPYYYYANGQIAVVDLNTVQSKTATSGADLHVLTTKFDEDTQALDWGPDGIYFGAQQKTNAHLYCVDPQSSAITRITAPDVFLLARLQKFRLHHRRFHAHGGAFRFQYCSLCASPAHPHDRSS